VLLAVPAISVESALAFQIRVLNHLLIIVFELTSQSLSGTLYSLGSLSPALLATYTCTKTQNKEGKKKFPMDETY
jgi:hypothetical protein